MSPADVPETPEALTTEWLGQALGWKVNGAERELLGQGQGFLGDIVRLRLDGADPATPASVIAKLPKKANRPMGEMLGVYEREVLFFQAYGADFPVRIPRIYFSHYDPDAGSARQKEILRAVDRLPRLLSPMVGYLGMRVAAAKKRRYLVVMEDLEAYRPGDQLAGADTEACARVLEQFAPAHRRFWAHPALDEQFWLLPMDIDARMREGILQRNVPAFLDEVGPGLRPYVAWLGDHYAQLARVLTREVPATLMHNDLRLDNVCFNGTDCAYLDWQLVRAGPAAYDVAYFLGSALHEAADAAAVEHILRRYHTALNVTGYEFEHLRRDYQRGLVLALAAVAPSADVTIDPGRGQAMMSRWRDRLARRLAGVELKELI